MDRLKIVMVGGVAGGASAAAKARRVNEAAQIMGVNRDHGRIRGGPNASGNSPDHHRR